MLFNKQDCGGASSAPFTLEPTTVPSVTDNPPGGGAMASGVHAANRATGRRTLPFKSSAFICHLWFLLTIHIPNHGPLGRDGGLEDESPLFPIRTEWRRVGVLIRGISMLIHNFITFADHRECVTGKNGDVGSGGGESRWQVPRTKAEIAHPSFCAEFCYVCG